MKRNIIPIALNLTLTSFCCSLLWFPQASHAQVPGEPLLVSTNQPPGGDDWTVAVWQTYTPPLVYFPSVDTLSGPLVSAAPGTNYELAYNGIQAGCGTGETRLAGAYGDGNTFPGDSLQLDANCGFLPRGSVLFTNASGDPALILNGGYICGTQGASGVSCGISGDIRVASTSFIATGGNGGGVDCGMNGNQSVSFWGAVSGPSTASLEIITTGGPSNTATCAGAVTGTTYAPAVQVTNGNNTFSGTWIVQCGWLQAVNPGSIDNGLTGSANILVDPNDQTWMATMPNAGPPVTQQGPGNGQLSTEQGTDGNFALFEPMYNVNSAGTLTLNPGGVLALHQFCCFAGVTISNVSLSPAIYTYDYLATNYPTFIYPGGYGELVVQPYGTPPAFPSVFIAMQPTPVTVYAYAPATLSVLGGVNGVGLLTYQWYSNNPTIGTNYYIIPGATNAAYSLTGAQTAAMAGQSGPSPANATNNYFCLVSNTITAATVDSTTNAITVDTDVPPVIQTQPAAIMSFSGYPVSMNVVATVPGGELYSIYTNFTYQWSSNNPSINGAAFYPIPGATNATYSLSGAQTAALSALYGLPFTNYYFCTVGNGILPNTDTITNFVELVAPTPYQQVIVNDNPISFFPMTEGAVVSQENTSQLYGGPAPNPPSADTLFDYVGGHNGNYINATGGYPGSSVGDGTTSVHFNGIFNDPWGPNGGANWSVPSYAGNINGINFGSATNVPSFSVECWAQGQLVNGAYSQSGENDSGAPNTAGLVCAGNTGYQQQGTFILDTGGSLTGYNGNNNYGNFYEFYINDYNNDIGYGGGFFTPSTMDATSTENGADGNWHHIVGVCDGNKDLVSIYIDGTISGTTAGITPDLGLANEVQPLIIGSDNWYDGSNTNATFRGQMDNVAIYAYALTPSQIKAHFLAAQEPPVFSVQAAPANALGTATFTADTNGLVGPLAYQWSVSIDGGNTYTALAGDTNGSLTLSGLTAAQNGNLYECVISGPNVPVAVTTTPELLFLNAQLVPANAGVNGSATFTSAATGPGPLTNQWYVSTNGGNTYTAIAGQTNASLTLSSLSAAQNGNYYENIVSGPTGSATNTPQRLNVTGGPPVEATGTADLPATVYAPVGTTVTLGGLDIVGTYPITYQWTSNGVSLQEGGRISGSSSGTLTIYDAQATDSANYQLKFSNGQTPNGQSGVSALIVAPVGLANLAWTTMNNNNRAPFSMSDPLVLTDGLNGDETATAYLNTPVVIDHFTAQFTYFFNDAVLPSGQNPDDGVVFVIQNDPLGANVSLGLDRDRLAIDTIAPSYNFIISLYQAALAYTTNGDTSDSALFDQYTYLGGEQGYPSQLYWWNNSVPVTFTITYPNPADANSALVTESSVVSGTTYTWSTTFAAPAGGLAALLGSHTAYLGFTATTSVSDAIQQISGFTFTSYGAAPTMSGSAANGTVTLSWPVGSVVGTIVLQSSSNLASGIWTPVTPAPPVTVVNGNYQVSVPAGDGQQYFQLMLEP